MVRCLGNFPGTPKNVGLALGPHGEPVLWEPSWDRLRTV
jgi:hypothetical protein